MSLKAFQQTLKDIVYTEKGRVALSSPDRLREFVEKRPDLNESERQYLLLMPHSRLQSYYEKIRSIYEDMLNLVFPFTKLLLSSQWDKLVMEYIETYPAISYRQISLTEKFPEFLALGQNRYGFPEALPELALFELLDGQLLNAMEPEYPEGLIHGVPGTVDELSRYRPVLNPLSRLVKFDYPVPALCASLSYLPAEDLEGAIHRCNISPRETWVMGYLKPGSGKYEYSIQTPMMGIWLNNLASRLPGELTYQESLPPLLDALRKEHPGFEPDTGFYHELLLSFRDFLDFGVLCGSIAL